MKSLSDRAVRIAVCLAPALVLGLASTSSAQTNYYGPNGTEYAVVGSLPGDQVFPDAAISPSGGFMVWQDNATDGDGEGVSAMRLDNTLSGTLSPFRVNAAGAGDQENARVALLKGGGAVFAWQGGTEGYQHIFARYLNAQNTFLTTTDLLVSTFTNISSFQEKPAIAVLNNSNVVVVWSSFNQVSATSLKDVYAKILSPAGATVKSEFLVNQFTNYNQRTPSVAALAGGGFVVTWVSEQQRVLGGASINETNGTLFSQINSPSVDIYARLYKADGTAATNEFVASTGNSPCANPSVAAGTDGGFMIAWSQRDLVTVDNTWDVYGRLFNSTGSGGAPFRLNTYVYGSQYAPRLSALGTDYLAVWTSLGQDGSREGVYGQFVRNTGALVGGEFRVNTTTPGQQMHPVVAADGVNQFLAVWTSFVGMPGSFDLYAQRYMNSAAILEPMPAPFVWAPFNMGSNGYIPELVVSWAPLLGLSVGDYEVYVDGGTAPMGIVTNNSWTMMPANGLTASSTHTFAVDYVTSDGRRSPISPATTGATWSWYGYQGIPQDWMAEYYGYNSSTWPANVNAPLVPGGPSLYQIFLSGGNPLDPATWLQQRLVKTDQGMFLTWNTTEGATYQVQVTTNFKNWTNVGSPRFAAGTNDAVNIGGGAAGYYRVNLLR